MPTRGDITFPQALRSDPLFSGQFDDLHGYYQGDFSVKLESVKSSNIESIGHDAEKSELHVKFRSGATHVYSDVSAQDHAALVGADSIGSHFHKNIRSKQNRKV